MRTAIRRRAAVVAALSVCGCQTGHAERRGHRDDERRDDPSHSTLPLTRGQRGLSLARYLFSSRGSFGRARDRFLRTRGSLRPGGAAHGLENETRGDVRIGVGVGSTILDVALAVLRDLPRDAHRRAAVAHAVAELLVRARLVEPGEALLDAEAVIRDVEIVPGAERLGRGDARVVIPPHPVR